MSDSREIKVVKIRGEDLRVGDIFRKVEWEDRRPVFRPALVIEPNGANLLVRYEPRMGHANSYILVNRYELLEVQVKSV